MHLLTSWFQSTHPLGVRPMMMIVTSCSSQFQSTHPLGMRLYYGNDRCKSSRVSIHAPTRGATNKADPVLHRHDVSIHAPTRGAAKAWMQNMLRKWFQSTHPLGVRPHSVTTNNGILEFQSTHPLGVRPP